MYGAIQVIQSTPGEQELVLLTKEFAERVDLEEQVHELQVAMRYMHDARPLGADSPRLIAVIVDEIDIELDSFEISEPVAYTLLEIDDPSLEELRERALANQREESIY
ncbi:hypothetical protein [Glutamicibacter sp. X7]